MKIVFAVHTYIPEKNGVQAVTQYIAEKLAKKNEVIVIVSKNDNVELSDREINNRVTIIRLTAYCHQRSHRYIGEKEKYIKLLKELSPELFICVCTQSWQFDWLEEYIDQIEGKKILYTHGFSGLCAYADNRYKGMSHVIREIRHKVFWRNYYRKYNKLMKSFDLVTHLSAVSESLRYAEENGLTSNCILGNAVEDIFFDKPVCFDEKKFKDIRPLRFICVSNFNPIKNQKGVIEAFFQAELGDSELVLIGSERTSYYEQLTNLCEGQEKGKRVIFLTNKTRVEISNYLSESDVFVTASLWEGYSVAVLEAAAKGLAIISTNVGNARIIPGVITVDSLQELPYIMEEIYQDSMIRMRQGQLLRLYAEEKAGISGRVKEFERQINLLFGEDII